MPERKITSSFHNWSATVSYSKLVFLGILTAGHLVVHWYTNLLSLVLPFIRTDLNLTNVEVGAIITTQMGVSSGLVIISGFVADSFRQKGAAIVSGSIISFGIAFFIIGMSPSYGWTLVGAGMVGVGTALWHPAALGALSICFPDHRGMALSVHGMGASVGDAIGPIIVGALIVMVDWKLALEFHLLPSLIIAILLWVGLGMMRNVSQERTNLKVYVASMKAMFVYRQTTIVMISNTLVTMGRLSLLAFFPIYIIETLDYSVSSLGVYLALLYVMGIISLPVMGIVSDRIGRKAVLVPSFISMGLLYAAIAIAAPGVSLGLTIAALGMFFYPIVNITQTALMDVAPEQVQSSTMGVMSLFGQPFVLISPIFAGYLVTQFGIESAFFYAAASALLAAAILIPVQFKRTM